MSDRRILVHRAFSYASLPLLSSLTPFLVLPVVARASTTTEWSALAIGQSLGLVGSLVVGYGWGVVGPPRVAQSDETGRRRLYAAALASRAAVLTIAGPVAAVVAWLAAPDDGPAQVLCVLTALSGALMGMSISWYCIGSGRPGAIARYEVVPRAVASVGAAGGVLLTGWLWLYPVALILASGVGVAAFSGTVLRGRRRRPEGTTGLAGVLRRQTVPTMVEVSAGSYTLGGGFIAGLVAPPQQIAQYGSADRLNQAALQAVVIVGSSLNPWVAESRGRLFAHRARVALVAHALLGLLGLAGIALLGPWASRLLFGDRLGASAATCVAFGFYFLAVSLQTALGRHILVSRGRVRAVLAGTLSGAATGIPSVLVGAHLFGATGAASGLAIGETVICLVMVVPATRAIRHERSE